MPGTQQLNRPTLDTTSREELIQRLVAGSRSGTAGKQVMHSGLSRPRRKRPTALGVLPERGLTDDQIAVVQNIMMDGDTGLDELSYRLRASIITMRDRLYESGFTVEERITIRFEVEEGTEGLRSDDINAVLNEEVETDIAPALREEKARQFIEEAEASLPWERKVAFTPAQLRALKRLLYGMNVGMRVAAEAFGISQSRLSSRLNDIGVRAVFTRKFRLCPMDMPTATSGGEEAVEPVESESEVSSDVSAEPAASTDES